MRLPFHDSRCLGPYNLPVLAEPHIDVVPEETQHQIEAASYALGLARFTRLSLILQQNGLEADIDLSPGDGGGIPVQITKLLEFGVCRVRLVAASTPDCQSFVATWSS